MHPAGEEKREVARHAEHEAETAHLGHSNQRAGRLFSKYKGKLLDQTIADLSQMLRNQQVNSSGRGFSNVVSLEDRKKR